jgi:hypothetical protein
MTKDNETLEIQFSLHATPASEKRSTDGPFSSCGKLPRLTQIMALAIDFLEMIQRGEISDYADLARLGCLSRERVSQMMEMVWLAPDIQEEILKFQPTGIPRFPISEAAVRQIAAVLSWEHQREEWARLKAQRQLG